MLKKIIIYTSLILLCLLTAFFVYKIRIDNPEKIEIKTTNVEPAKFDRNFISYDFSPISSVSDSISKHLILPRIIQSESELIYILDLKDNRVYRFTKSGKLLNTIGKGKGRGPGEMLHANGFYVNNDRIWVIDHRLFNTNRFRLNGTYEHTFTSKYRPIRIAGSKDQLVIKTIADEFLFKRVDFQGKVLGEFGNFADNQVKNPLSFTGQIVMRSNTTIYIPNIASLIFFYRADTLYHIAKRPDGKNFKSSINRSSEDRKFYRAPEADIEARSTTIYSDKLYIAEFKKNVKNDSDEILSQSQTFVDVYNAKTGRYQHSFHTPEPAREIWLDDELLLLIDDKTDDVKAYNYVVNK